MEADALTPALVRSVGWVIKETEDSIVLVSQNGENEIDGEICIVKVCIKHRKVLLKDD